MGTPAERVVGNVGIRAVPLTNEFRSDLLKQLRRIQKTTHFSVNVDRAKVDRGALQRAIQAQLAGIENLNVKVSARVDRAELSKSMKDAVTEAADKAGDGVKVNLRNLSLFDKATLRRVEEQMRGAVEKLANVMRGEDIDTGFLRHLEQIEAEFKHLKEKLSDPLISEEAYRTTLHRIDEIADEMDEAAKNRRVIIEANPNTAWASSRLSWLTRPRIVEIIPVVSKTALTAAGTALAALSGARMSYDMLDNFLSWVGNLDKKLPALTLGLTAAATGFGAVFDTIAGIVGIGDGFAAMLPSLLVLPGLLAGAVMSGAGLFVALKYSKEELASLGDSYNNLGAIIRKAFWGEARDAIIEFSNSVMPQLERSFDRTSRSMGRFTADLARSFQKHFANGRLEKMFDGLAEAWDILATGTDAFGGAITNLGLVAARYMPRLAQWFVDLSIEFDNWLSAVATDGRLDGWIEESIDSFYALWDVLAATTGIFQGIWKAAEAGGNEGLRGWADMLLAWEAAVQGQKWQETLIAFFTGANTAMAGLSGGLQEFGEMLHGLRDPIGNFIGEGGQALGKFIGDLSKAFNRPEITKGLDELIGGLADGLSALAPAMGPIADAFGVLMGFIGELAAVFGPLLSRVLSALAPVFSSLLRAIEPVIVILAEGLATAIETIAPVLEDFITSIDIEELAVALAEAFIGITEALIPLLPALVPIVNSFIEELIPILPDLVTMIDSMARVLLQMLEVIAPHLPALMEFVGVIVQLAALNWEMIAEGFGVLSIAIDSVLTVFSIFLSYITIILQAVADVSDSMLKLIQGDFAGAAESAGNALRGVAEATDFTWVTEKIDGLISRSEPKLQTLVDNAKKAGDDFSEKMRGGIDKGIPGVGASSDKMAKDAGDKLKAGAVGMDKVGAQFGQGFAAGIRSEINTAAAAAARMAAAASAAAKAELDINSPSRVARDQIGRMFGAGFVMGQDDSIPDIRRSSERMANAAIEGMVGKRDRVRIASASVGFSAASAVSGSGAGEVTPSVLNLNWNQYANPGLAAEDELFAAAPTLKAVLGLA
ncbi:phage tail protein [Leucobacter sp. Z1108]|uniref:phage tail protein n=1 Tax=Leucobacter sp. Z1108 TaxID=3439066 RepID=UPI003F32489F